MWRYKKGPTFSTLNKAEILQGERELSMECRVMTGVKVFNWKISWLYFWAEDWNIDGIILEDILHIISYDL
jgi:hypothetical protein